MIVLDASAALELLLGRDDRRVALAERIARLPRVHVPELFDLEVMSAFRGLERGGLISESGSGVAISKLEELRAVRWRHEELRPGIWRRRHQMSTYDAAYVTLARLLDLPLITADAMLASSIGSEIAVELFEPPIAPEP